MIKFHRQTQYVDNIGITDQTCPYSTKTLNSFPMLSKDKNLSYIEQMLPRSQNCQNFGTNHHIKRIESRKNKIQFFFAREQVSRKLKKTLQCCLDVLAYSNLSKTACHFCMNGQEYFIHSSFQTTILSLLPNWWASLLTVLTLWSIVARQFWDSHYRGSNWYLWKIISVAIYAALIVKSIQNYTWNRKTLGTLRSQRSTRKGCRSKEPLILVPTSRSETY